MVENVRNEIVKEADRIREDSEYSSINHFEAGRIWMLFHYLIGIPSTFFALGVVKSLYSKEYTWAIGLSVFVAFLSFLITVLNPKEKAMLHKNAGNEYRALRNEARIFQNIESQTGNEDDLVKELKRLSSRRHDINRHSPPIPARWIFTCLTKRRLKNKETEYRIDK